MTYVRMYATEQQARDAVGKLREDGFPEDTILLVTPSQGGAAVTVDNLKAAITAGFMVGKDASVYAEAVGRGRSLVVVRPAFGFGQAALNILDACGPVDTHLVQKPEPPVTAEKGTPLSSFFQWRVLRPNEPAPFSDFLGLPLLSSRQTCQSDTIGKLSGPMIDNSVGLRLLSHKATPLSSLFGLQTLLDQPVHWESSFGLPLQSRSPAPLSSLFGLPLLIGQRR